MTELELRQMFKNLSDCYADTRRFEDDGSYTEGEVIQAMTEDRFIEALEEAKLLPVPVFSGRYYWVKLMADDKHEPTIAINLLGVMNFEFFNGLTVPCDKVNDYSECNYR